MKPLILKNFAKWKELNKGNKFSLYDYIFHINKLKKVDSDIYFAFFELFWPSFIIYKDYILLKENFSEEKVEDLIKREEKVEFWMNLFITDPYFENDDDEKSEFLAGALMQVWQAKLEKDFPGKNFIVKYICDEEYGDYGLTFYQKI
ncbi:MAG: hypothetical protein ACRDAI_04265 [Candidatus Rhabdochlamydia sp.]